MVFVDGKPLQQVLARGLIRRGTFFRDTAGKKIAFALADYDSPRQIEVSARQRGLWIHGDHLRIKGLTVRHVANDHEQAALRLWGHHCLLENCRAEWNNLDGIEVVGGHCRAINNVIAGTRVFQGSLTENSTGAGILNSRARVRATARAGAKSGTLIQDVWGSDGCSLTAPRPPHRLHPGMNRVGSVQGHGTWKENKEATHLPQFYLAGLRACGESSTVGLPVHIHDGAGLGGPCQRKGRDSFCLATTSAGPSRPRSRRRLAAGSWIAPSGPAGWSRARTR
jgi:hypothetical protein